jgi:hypothetical protein
MLMNVIAFLFVLAQTELDFLHKKSPTLCVGLFWSGWRDSNSRPLAPHTGIFHFVIF